MSFMSQAGVCGNGGAATKGFGVGDGDGESAGGGR